ncbi:DUF6519 domain-containing protein [Filimonas lacunae]|nr:DUF6519 domain-containing protein [Filimonas lacunae]BAV06592.1 hypothetical protein FLA_2611 [Filimonas lacunae]
MQQGRVLLDADWNEQLDIQQYRTFTETTDVIGQSGVPKNNEGFKIGIATGGTDLSIAAGRLYVEGLLCELESGVTYLHQPSYPAPATGFFIGSPVGSPPSSPPTSPVGSPPSQYINLQDGTYIVYLEAWQKEVNFRDDMRIQEVALGEADTTVRLQTTWQVKLLKVVPGNASPNCNNVYQEWTNLVLAPSNKLTAKTVHDTGNTNACQLSATAGYQRLENQLYRVEIHKPAGNGLSMGTFKWSRDNASVETVIEKVAGNIITVTDTGKDDVLNFAIGHWVEIIDDIAANNGTPNDLIQITDVNKSTREITLSASVAAFTGKPNLKLRRWDQSGVTASPQGIVITNGWVTLEDGVQVKFENNTNRSGDYWLIAGRTATGEIEWPPYQVPNTAPQALLPQNPPHRFTRLALLQVQSGQVVSLLDCRKKFPPLTAITASDVSYDNTKCTLNGAKTVQEALDLLCASRQGSCIYQAIPGPGWEGVFATIPDGQDAQICFQTGDYPMSRTITVRNKGHLKLEGCGFGTRLLGKGDAGIVFESCESVLLRDIYAETQAIGYGQRYDPLAFIDCRRVHITHVYAKSGASPDTNTCCIYIRNKPELPGEVIVQDCLLEPGYQQQGVVVINATRSYIANNTIRVYEKPKVLTLENMMQSSTYRAALRYLILSNTRFKSQGTWQNIALTSANYMLSFKTYKLLTLEDWLKLYNENRTDRVLRPGALQLFLYKLVDKLFADEALRNKYKNFRTLVLSTINQDVAMAAKGIVVAGQLAGDVQILNNNISGVRQGIHVGLSHYPGGKGDFDIADVVRIAGNTIDLLLNSTAANADRHGIFVGNNNSVNIHNNVVKLTRMDNAAELTVDGIVIWGKLGPKITIAENHVYSTDGNSRNGFTYGIRIQSATTITPTFVPGLWIISSNMAPSKLATIKAPGYCVLVPNTNAPAVFIN